MKITVEIQDEELQASVEYTLTKRIVEKIEEELYGDKHYSYDKRVYVEAIKTGVRQLLKEHIEDITGRATEAAARSIESKGIKKLLAEIKEVAAE